MPPYPNLQFLDCGNNNLHRLPPLSDSLTYLDCPYNIIDSIIDLPNNITSIDLGFNNLKSFGIKLPDSLQFLSCNDNQLSVLPSLPKGLFYLGCSNNLLTSLPELPDSMDVLACENNPNLHCLPELKRINSLFFDSIGITCLPDYGNVTLSIPPLDSVPLCVAGNPNGCPIYSGINEVINITNALTLYPNPTSATCTLQTDGSVKMSAAIITDALGRQVVPLFNGQQVATFQFSCNALASGLYFIMVEDEYNNKGVLKLTIQ